MPIRCGEIFSPVWYKEYTNETLLEHHQQTLNQTDIILNACRQTFWYRKCRVTDICQSPCIHQDNSVAAREK